MKIKLYATLSFCFFVAFSTVALATDIVINSSSGSQSLNADNRKITISPGGDVAGGADPAGIYGIGSAAQVIVNANSGSGVSGNTSAITMLGSTLDLSLNTGRITGGSGGQHLAQFI